MSITIIAQSLNDRYSGLNNLGRSEMVDIASPYLYSKTILTTEDHPWLFNYSGSYGERVQGQFGYDGLAQHFSIKGAFARNYTLLANVSLGVRRDNQKMVSAQQIEVLRNIVNIEKLLGLKLGLGLGAGMDYQNTKLLISRVVISLKYKKWNATGNVYLEKAFASDRDVIDAILSGAISYRFSNRFMGGGELVCEDVEGFWDKNEAEGGAKLFLGPTLNYRPQKSRFVFSLAGGPVLYVTSNQNESAAVRVLPSEDGLTMRGKITFEL